MYQRNCDFHQSSQKKNADPILAPDAFTGKPDAVTDLL